MPIGDHPTSLGLVLAGGAGRRLGGVDKALLAIGGRTILARALDVLRPDCRVLAISANGDPARFASFGALVLPDADAGGSGPLAGLLAGMECAAGLGLDWVASVPGDAPFLPEGLVGHLHAERGAAPAAIAASGGRRHPVVGLWAVSLKDRLHRSLADGERRVGRWADAAGARIVEWPHGPLDLFLNVNEPEDLAAARIAAGATPA